MREREVRVCFGALPNVREKTAFAVVGERQEGVGKMKSKSTGE